MKGRKKMKREQTIITKIDEKHSVMMTFYTSGKPKRETHFKGNDIHGMRIEWYPNGSPKAVYNYSNDRRSGKYRAWWPNGRLKEDGNFKNDKLNGYVYCYDKFGKFIASLCYVDDEIDETRSYAD